MRFLKAFVLATLAVLTSRAATPARAADAPARLVVRLPADATLTIDGEPTQSTSGVRYFVTSPLRPGTDYHYELTARWLRDGKGMATSRRITVRAGAETATDLYPPATENRPAPAAFAPRVGGGLPGRTASDESVGGARDNWKPDPTDPFYPWQ